MTNEEIKAKIAENRKKAQERNEKPFLCISYSEYEFIQGTILRLSRALDKACERLDWDCPVSQDLIDDLDCENCTNNSKSCWRKYFLGEVNKK